MTIGAGGVREIHPAVIQPQPRKVRAADEAPPPAALSVLWRPVLLVSIAYLGLAAAISSSLDGLGTADAYEHLDYVWQLMHGTLPAPYGHDLQLSGVDRSAFLSDESRQYASAHPPLFYLLAALVGGPALLSGHWQLAVALIRSFNVLLGLIGLLVLVWFGWEFGGRRRATISISLASLGTLSFTYLRFSGEVYNDLLVCAFSLVAVTISCLLVRDGPRRGRLILLVVVCAAGFGAKATFVLTLAISCAAVLVAFLLHRPFSPRMLGKAVLAAVAPAVAGVVAWGWFYAANAAASGSWYRSTPKAQVQDRPYHSLTDNLLDLDFYLIVPQRLLRSSLLPGMSAPAFSLFAVTALALSTVAVITWRIAKREWRPDKTALVIAGLLGLQLLGSYVMQLSHATGYGQLSVRYFLPATIPIATVLGWGIASLGRVSALLVPAAAAVFGTTTFYAFAHTAPARTFADAHATMARLLADNGLPAVLGTACVLSTGAALAGLVFALRRAQTLAGEPRGVTGR